MAIVPPSPRSEPFWLRWCHTFLSLAEEEGLRHSLTKGRKNILAKPEMVERTRWVPARLRFSFFLAQTGSECIRSFVCGVKIHFPRFSYCVIVGDGSLDGVPVPSLLSWRLPPAGIVWAFSVPGLKPYFCEESDGKMRFFSVQVCVAFTKQWDQAS